MQDMGCLACLKHFPGLGASEVDSQKQLPTVLSSEAEIREKDLHPYTQLLRFADVRAVMVAHAAYKNLRLQEADQSGKLLPSSLSPAIISTLLRGELGFDGLVLTDDLEMGAIVENYGIGEACKMAIGAGVDMLAICASTDAIKEGVDAVSAAVERGEIGEDRIDRSLDRIAYLKKTLHAPLPIDNDRLEQLSNEITELNARLK
jgi:beta-N-acetylhexosaminidase